MKRPGEPGPVDLRLVVPALAAWAAAALALDAPVGRTAVGAGLGVLGAGLLLLAACRRPESLWRIGPAAAAALLCAAAGAGVAGLQRAEARAGPVVGLAGEHARVLAELTVGSDPRAARGGSGPPAVVLDAVLTRVTGPDGTQTRVETPVRVLAGHPGWARLQPSTRVAVVARLAPGRAGERAVALLRPAGDIPPRVTGGPDTVQRIAGSLRAGLREATEGLAPDARALLPGLVVGDTSRVPPELDEAFRATDLLHLLAVSGSNLTVVLFLLIGPPAAAQRAERGGLAPRLGLSLRATALCGAALTSAFVVVCRPEPSVLRAAACGAITLLAIATGRRRSLIPALAAAVLLLVLHDPWLARSPGFLLSVLATGSLLTLGPRWSEALRRRGTRPRLAEALGAAAAAQAVCAPVVAVLSARVSLVAVPCNLLAELAAGPATVLGFATLAAAPVCMPVAELLARCAGVPAGWIAGVARTGARLPGAELAWPGGLTGGLLLAAASLAVVGLGARIRHRPWVCTALAVLLLLAVLRPPQLTRTLTRWPPPDWSYVQCAVGQGDAAVLAVGPGTAVVVDAGPQAGPVDECLRALGVNRVPLLLLTHFHADHVGGLSGVLRGRSVGVIQTTTLEEPAAQAEFVRRTAAAARVPVVAAAAGERRRAGRLEWQVLWPSPDGPRPEGPNDASVALLVRSAGLTLLLLGDLEPPSQEALLRARPDLGPVDVLKVAHHIFLVEHLLEGFGVPGSRPGGAVDTGGSYVLRGTHGQRARTEAPDDHHRLRPPDGGVDGPLPAGASRLRGRRGSGCPRGHQGSAAGQHPTDHQRDRLVLPLDTRARCPVPASRSGGRSRGVHGGRGRVPRR
ncbi:ComEC/Rec2 family competence protein [Streptomyces sp. NBC_01343]|uniref:ComEC/Rec2 family competence protein n=1 Tax=Streptomyces sp. NBC_01343 TaxID=2903832 RepID=UPI002E0F22F6|nr:ComEC/Rec2 family competence protein [Streptomyces sp. NBC_01343]